MPTAVPPSPAGALFTSDRGLFAYRTDDQVLPTAELTAPEDGTTVIGEVVLDALSSDERGIDSVVFRVDGSPVATVTNPTSGNQFGPGAPLHDHRDTATLTVGKHIIDAVATDESGNSATSASRTINVDNTRRRRHSTAAPSM